MVVRCDETNQLISQYNVFERRLADKLSYLDWKLSFVLNEEDFLFIHEKPDATSKFTETKREGSAAL